MGIISKLRNTAYLLSGHGLEFGRERWDREYRTGEWEYLRGLDQMPRYSVVAGYLQYYRPGGAVLDVGCGEGILQRILPAASCTRYVGLDFSAPAIEAARAGADERCAFHQCDAADWEPADKYDVIIFNEVLYYFRDPVAVLRKYEAALQRDGLFLVSMYSRAGNTRRIWNKVARAYVCLHATKVKTGRAKCWIVKVLGREGVTSATALRRHSARHSRTEAPGHRSEPERS